MSILFVSNENVPSDWNSYNTTCIFCKKKYHASEGSCSCIDELDGCHCGDCKWILQKGELICETCGTKPGEAYDEEDND